MSSSQKTLLGRFLILGKLYFITFTVIVCIFPICSSLILTTLVLSIESRGRLQSKSNIVLMFLFLSVKGVHPSNSNYYTCDTSITVLSLIDSSRDSSSGIIILYDG